MSLDWLLGLSQDEGVTGEIREAAVWHEGSDGTTAVRLQLPSSGSIFAVFRRSSAHVDPLVAFAPAAAYTVLPLPPPLPPLLPLPSPQSGR